MLIAKGLATNRRDLWQGIEQIETQIFRQSVFFFVKLLYYGTFINSRERPYETVWQVNRSVAIGN